MRIERVDDKTVKCFLSNEELEEYEIDYKDFILRSDKAREIVQEIIEQAEEEVGYKPPKFAFDLQIMLLPDQGLILTFSESQQNQQAAVGEGAGNGQEAQEQASRPSFAVFAFSGIGRIMEFASVLPSNLLVESSLYEMDGLYYLYLLRGRASYERYSRACVQAMEFGSLYAADESQVLRLKEHGQCLIAEKAVKKLRG